MGGNVVSILNNGQNQFVSAGFNRLDHNINNNNNQHESISVND